MQRQVSFFWTILLCTVVGLLAISTLPFQDTSEPRYAEIARVMLASGDWITPWFEEGVPFWGKPPLSFWLQAASMGVFGVNEFAARLPSFLSTVLTTLILWQLALETFGRRVAQQSVIIFISSALVMVAAGAVLTDPFLALGTTLSMASLILSRDSLNQRFWKYGFFVGLAIGLLAKGPLALVLTFAPIVLWVILSRVAWSYIKGLPWITGSLLTLSISLPWYILAELKTPGFLNYFIVGEHIMRYIDPGWANDLYGRAHERPLGTIWLLWLLATFPWGIYGLAMLFKHVKKQNFKINRLLSKQQPIVLYLVLWSLLTPMFFTMAHNILWTYLLPCIGAFSILLGRVFESQGKGLSGTGSAFNIARHIAPLAIVAYCLWGGIFPEKLKSEADLISFIEHEKGGALDGTHLQLLYLDEKMPFSARFYSQGVASQVSEAEIREKATNGHAFLAVPKHRWQAFTTWAGQDIEPIYTNLRYMLIDVNTLNDGMLGDGV